MDPTYIHLLLNHIPIIGMLFSLILLAYGYFFKNASITRAALLSAVFIALITIPTYFSGEESEEAVEEIAGISKHFLHEHEELAEVAFIIMLVNGGLALLTLLFDWMKTERISKMFRPLTLLFTMVTFGFMVAVGYYGGKIRHTELSNEVTQKSVTNSPANLKSMSEDEDDD